MAASSLRRRRMVTASDWRWTAWWEMRSDQWGIEGGEAGEVVGEEGGGVEEVDGALNGERDGWGATERRGGGVGGLWLFSLLVQLQLRLAVLQAETRLAA